MKNGCSREPVPTVSALQVLTRPPKHARSKPALFSTRMWAGGPRASSKWQAGRRRDRSGTDLGSALYAGVFPYSRVPGVIYCYTVNISLSPQARLS